MCINNLPHDILSLVLKQTVGEQAQSMQNWKHSIHLLAVCRKWRVLAQPWVHSFAFIEAYDGLDEGYESDSQDNNSAIIYNISGQEIDSDVEDDVDVMAGDQSRKGPVWMTNIDFHLLHGKKHMVKYLQLYLDTQMHLVTFLRKVQDILVLDKYQWPRIRALDINIYSILDALDEFSENEDKQIAEVDHISGLIFQSLSGVQKLTVLGHISHIRDIVSCSFGSKIINLYLPQLQYICSHVYTKLSAPTMSNRLEHLKLFMDATTSFDHLRMHTGFLKYIFLINTPIGFPWHNLADETTENKINFPNLESLQLMFESDRYYTNEPLNLPRINAKQSNSPGYKKRLKIYLPKLKILRLEFPPLDCPFFDAEVYPLHLDLIHITAPFSALERLHHMNIKSINRLDIYLDTVSATDETSFYNVTNHLFGKIHISDELYFSIRTQIPFSIDPARISWTMLTSLDLNATIDFAFLLKLIGRIPSLIGLVFKNISVEAFMEDVKYIDSPRWQQLLSSPLDSKLEGIGPMGNYRQHSTHFTCNIIYFMIQRIRSLKHVYIKKKTFKNQIDMLLQHSPNPHPHVRNVIVIDSE
ncbi:hypothetical protein GGI25_000194 [Coemansia spiralis]|uniref:F-box domain-containing protein n=2 Tax=Coemansia TaxID=4863 RepID=A0A9W8GF48_9FUNG|nr:hypothetical protein EDC05_006010 [Coemansia umbellata]KAJ2625767.1 hypothetical protein GGI26_000228 [Coemansia sp. RSA 1358]KAJ2680890.1 hypothetical protein GGI25_000194 [Coemansia spiralis]